MPTESTETFGKNRSEVTKTTLLRLGGQRANAPEIQSGLDKLDSYHASTETEMLFANERYAAPLIFLGEHIYQDELLAGGHSCRKCHESAAEVQPTDVGFLPKWFLVVPTAVNQNRQILYQVLDRVRSAHDRNFFLEREAVKTIAAAFASEGPSK